ncbi:MAG: hypothetical protein FWG56_00830 [Desulfovibrionaceae bacterium]|nr:hypothetical protein [Desulfovibrionaceae bacterium]
MSILLPREDRMGYWTSSVTSYRLEASSKMPLFFQKNARQKTDMYGHAFAMTEADQLLIERLKAALFPSVPGKIKATCSIDFHGHFVERAMGIEPTS